MGMIIQNGILMSSSKVEIQPVIYSENEREIGVWIDGKTLYEKTIPVTTSVGSYTLDVSALNIDYLVEAVARIHNNTGGDYSVAPYYESSNDKFNYYFTSNKQSIVFRSGSTYSIGSGYITIRYTKTTDTAGSGIWATTGLPAHHYSTSEQVVGTWVDGSTIYEKTLPITNINGLVGWHQIDTIPNIQDLIDGFAKVKDINDAYGYTNLPLDILYSTGMISFYNCLGGPMGMVSGYAVVRYTKTSTSNTRSFSKGGSKESVEETKSEEKLEEPIEEKKLEESVEEKKLEESVDEKEA